VRLIVVAVQKWLSQHNDCPTCRKPMAKNDVMWINLEMRSSTKDTQSECQLTGQYGTKPAALVRFIQGAMQVQPNRYPP
jgi:hypothetical protein